MTTYQCIKPACGNSYESNEDEAYYCPSCIKEKEAIAKQVDAKLASRPKKPAMSDYQVALEKGKMTGNGLFVRAGDLGISF